MLVLVNKGMHGYKAFNMYGHALFLSSYVPSYWSITSWNENRVVNLWGIAIHRHNFISHLSATSKKKNTTKKKRTDERGRSEMENLHVVITVKNLSFCTSLTLFMSTL